MKIFTKYHLNIGLIVAIVLPGIFVFDDAKNGSSQLLIKFTTFFGLILLFWIITFGFVDFKKPGFISKEKKGSKLYLQILYALITCFAVYFALGLLFPANDFLQTISGEEIYSLKAWFYLCFRITLLVVFFLIGKYLFDSNEEKQQIKMENEILKRENLNAQHETLRQQVNPHFLFNSLNTLKSLIKRDASQALSFTEELALVYRYMLFHVNKKEVYLSEEIDFLKSYLFLLKIRFGDAIFTRIEVPAPYLDCFVPPNTLQLLIENAVKHNIFSVSKPLSIYLFVENDFLVVSNNLQEKEASTASSNIGLANINSRYVLSKGKEIIIEKSTSLFKVSLPLLKNS
ncbi:sensor histidine kinase [Bizionia paragorgiae]|uniref:sensor histidine kinase n=1 Tax=Bizionia paragorgiae TaxID=283786 RepID=UPI003A900A20